MALAILSIGIFVLIACTAKCLAVIRMSRHYQNARLTLERGELDHPLVWTNEPDQNAVAPRDYPGGYTYSRTLAPVDGEESLYRVTTRVAWSESGQAAGEEVVGLFYSPKDALER